MAQVTILQQADSRMLEYHIESALIDEVRRLKGEVQQAKCKTYAKRHKQAIQRKRKSK